MKSALGFWECDRQVELYAVDMDYGIDPYSMEVWLSWFRHAVQAMRH